MKPATTEEKIKRIEDITKEIAELERIRKVMERELFETEDLPCCSS